MSKPVFLSLLRGTLQTFFKVATVALKDSSGRLEIRNSSDTGYAGLTARNLKLTLSPSAGYVLTSDAVGLASWAAAPASGLIVGEVRAFAFSTVPAGWLACDGALVSRTTYASLFTAIATTYGSGDGSTTFKLPDIRGRAPIGAGQGQWPITLTTRTLGQYVGEESHYLQTNELPSHNHVQHAPGDGQAHINSGAAGTNVTYSPQSSTGTNLLSTDSTGGGAAHNNIQPSLALQYCIYAGA